VPTNDVVNYKSSDSLTCLICCGIRLHPLCQIINEDHDVSVPLSGLQHFQNVHTDMLEGVSTGIGFKSGLTLGPDSQ